MKKKFETNVAEEMPKTKFREPNLPWKLTNADLEEMGPKDSAASALGPGSSPFEARAVFPILLVLTIFTVALYMMSNSMIERENIRTDILKKEAAISSLKTDLEKAESEKRIRDEGSTELEKQVNDLKAQKELYTSVIETLTKKTDEP